jgi:RHS repeat-associated protein
MQFAQLNTAKSSVFGASYPPFGMQLPERHESVGDSYRYGFQNQEVDSEVKGEGNSVNYKYRMHDPRLGRFFAVDPLADKYPHNSPYAFSENRVIASVELEGLEAEDLYSPAGHERKDGTFNGSQLIAEVSASPRNTATLEAARENYRRSFTKNYIKYWNTPEVDPTIVSGTGADRGYSNKQAIDNWMYDAQGFVDKVSSGVQAGIKIVAVMATGGGSALTSRGFEAGVNMASNLVGQYASTGNFSDIDYFDVAAEGVGGLLKNPWAKVVLPSLTEALVDIDGNGNVKTVLNKSKSVGETSSDMFFGVVSGATNVGLEKAGMSKSFMNTRTSTTGTATEYLNNEVNKKL